VILLLAVALGAAAGVTRALLAGRSYAPPALRGIGWAFVAFLPQYFAFFFPPLRGRIDQNLAAILLVSSLLLLLVFAWQNRSQVAFYWLGLGLLLNLLVIALNGGLMPISPMTVMHLYPEDHPNALEIGSRLGYSKNVVLYASETRLEWLADRFLFPGWIPVRVAYSVGDVFIAVGAFWLMWQSGAGVKRRQSAGLKESAVG
jgi:hypothetical protein